MKKEPAAEKKKESKTLKGNVNGEPIKKGSEGYVHYYLSNFAGPLPRSSTKLFVPQKRKLEQRSYDFVQAFKSNFDSHFSFEEINSPEKIVNILKNITPEYVREYFGGLLPYGFERLSKQAKDLKVNEICEDVKQLRVCGSNSLTTIEDIIHVPKD